MLNSIESRTLLKRYINLEKISESSTVVIYKAESISNGKHYIIKSFRGIDKKTFELHTERINNQIKIQENRNVLPITDFYADENTRSLYFATQVCTPVSKQIEEGVTMTDDNMLKFIREMAECLDYAKEHIQQTHNNIHTGNVMFIDGAYKLTDWDFPTGYSRPDDSIYSHYCRMIFTAPEVLLKLQQDNLKTTKKDTIPEEEKEEFLDEDYETYYEKADIYSIGIVCLRLFGVPEKKLFNIKRDQVKQGKKLVRDEILSNIPSGLSQKLSDLLHGMLQFESSKRFDLPAILEKFAKEKEKPVQKEKDDGRILREYKDYNDFMRNNKLIAITEAQVDSNKVNLNAADPVGVQKTISGLRQKSYQILELSCSGLDSQAIQDLCSELPYQHNLKSLTLTFANSPRLGDRDLEALSDALQKMKLLNSLSFFFIGCKEITDRGLDYLADAIASLNYVIVVGLTFKEGIITDQSLGVLSQALSRCFSLTSLYLDFEECYKITDSGLGYLSQALTRLNSLKTLSIKLDWSKSITDQGFNMLCQGIYKIGMLTTLELSLYTCRNLTDQSLNLIPQCLAKSLSLQNLTLNFSWLEAITDSGIEQVSLLISRLNSIQTLSLKFDGCTNLTDHSLAQLSVAIARSGVNNLKDLAVSFDGCKQLSDTGITILAQNLQKLGQLKRLNISFKECWKLTKSSLQQIYLQLSKAASNLSLKVNHGWKSAGSYSELADLFKDEISFSTALLSKQV